MFTKKVALFTFMFAGLVAAITLGAFFFTGMTTVSYLINGRFIVVLLALVAAGILFKSTR